MAPYEAPTTQAEFLSTLSLRRATHTARKGSDNEGISIHALLAESDQAQSLKVAPLCISIHALLAESDRDLEYKRDQTILFLSTLSLRRATQLPDG